MKKSYFMRTFRLDGYLLLISVLLFVAEFGFMLIGLFLHGQEKRQYGEIHSISL